MAEASGNNEDSKDVLESPEVKAAIEAAKKQAESDGYRKGQSDTDKSTQAALDKATDAQTKLTALENQRFENLSDDDKQKEIINKMWAERNLPTSTVDEGKSSQDPAPKPDSKADPKQQLVEAAKAEGLDPSKLDMDSGTAKFLASWSRLVKEGKGSEAESSSEEDKEQSSSKSGGPVDRGGGSPTATDITKVNPNNIFANAFNKNHGGSN